MSDPVKPVPEKQAELNAGTRHHWRAYASHRRAMERLLLADLPAPPSPPGRLCVLGAGNCNDLDLRWLAKAFREVHLVDIDAGALAAAVARQGVAEGPAGDGKSPGTFHGTFHRHAPIDLTGVADVVVAWAKSPPDDAAVIACARRAAAHRVTLEAPRPPNEVSDGAEPPPRRIHLEVDWRFDPSRPPAAVRAPSGAAPAVGGFDVVLSPCVLSQLFNPARDALGKGHPRVPDMIAALRAGHVRSMAALLAPGGVGLLVTDLLASTTFPALPRVREEEAPDAMRAALSSGNHFAGLDPASLGAAVRAEATLTDLRQSRPWLWQLGWARTYLVYALRFRKREAGR